MTRLSNPPLREAIFSAKWLLEDMGQGYKYDLGLEKGVIRLEQSLARDLPRLERRLPLGIGVPFTMNFQPTFRFQPQAADFPQVQLGAGVFFFNEAGSAYEFDAFRLNVEKYLEALKTAYLPSTSTKAPFELRPEQFTFLLFNRIELTEWDRWKNSTEPTLASEFIERYLKFKSDTPLDRLGENGLTLYRQMHSQTYILPDKTGQLTVSVRDVSKSHEEQIVEWDQEVIVKVNSELLEPGAAAAWLSKAHVSTHAVFMLMTQDEELTRYFNTEPIR